MISPDMPIPPEQRIPFPGQPAPLPVVLSPPETGPGTRPAGHRPVLMALLAALLLVAAGAGAYYTFSASKKPDKKKDGLPEAGIYPTAWARMGTDLGVIVVALFGNETPHTVDNFIKLCDRSFYNGTIFHRVIRDFVIQGGGFVPGLGQKAAPFPPIKLEISPKLNNSRGTIAMARTSDPDSATSQFFINLVDNPVLDPDGYSSGYSVFGRVIEGMDVVDAIGESPTSRQATPQGYDMDDVPATPILIGGITVLSSAPE